MKGFTPSGEPRMGARFNVKMTDGTTEIAKVVGKGYGRGRGKPLLTVILEWPDGVRQPSDWPEVREAMSPAIP